MIGIGVGLIKMIIKMGQEMKRKVISLNMKTILKEIISLKNAANNRSFALTRVYKVLSMQMLMFILI